MRQAGEVDDHGVSRHVLSQKQGDAHLSRLRVGFLDDLAQADQVSFGVGNFHADGVLAGNGSHDSHAGNAQGDGQIVGQSRYLAKSQAGLQLDLELREAVYDEMAMTQALIAREEAVEGEFELPQPSSFLIHSLKQSRQVKSARMEYFDGPVLGVLAYITSVEIEEAVDQTGNNIE